MVSVHSGNFALQFQQDKGEQVKKAGSLTGFLISLICACGWVQGVTPETNPPFYTPEAGKWADSVLSTLQPDERIAQLIMVAAWSNKGQDHVNEIKKLISNWGIGGLIFFQGGPLRQATLTNEYQSLSKVPLLIGIDGEWGLNMRLDSTIRFPRQMTLSAGASDSLVYAMGMEIARECKRLGIQVNFAPDADVNDNPLNPIIGSRAFGDNREEVTQRALLYMKGLQDHHVLATGKHFPGHGNADTDSHLALPTIYASRAKLDSVELYPFRHLIRSGLGSVMVAHLFVPSLDSTQDLPSTLSAKVVNDLLKKEMGFKGLVFTDALNMKGVSSCYRPGVLDKTALLAGNDILLYSENVHKAVDEIHIAVQNCEISQEEIDSRVKKLLMVKFWTGLNTRSRVDTNNLYQDLNPPEALNLQRKLYEASVTVVKNNKNILPLKNPDKHKIASVVIGDEKNNGFQTALDRYVRVDHFSENKNATAAMYEALFDFLRNYDLVIVSLHGTNMLAQKKYGVPDDAAAFIDTLMIEKPVIFVDFGNAYTLGIFKNISRAQAVVLAYEDFPMVHEIAAEVVMGGDSSNGKIPVTINAALTRGSGVSTGPVLRLGEEIPEAEGVSSAGLSEIDTIVNRAIAARAFPGCQVLVAKNSKVIYQKSFGYHTYDSCCRVLNTDLYDIASVTKITGTALAAMKLFDKRAYDLNQPLSKYLSKLKSTNKKGLTIREIMAHQAGLRAWEPFWKRTMQDSIPSPEIYRKIPEPGFETRVCDSLYIRDNYADSIYQWILQSPVKDRGKYVYSDFGPMLIQKMVEKISGKPLDQYLEEMFYKPLQLNHTLFRPWESMDTSVIVPTVRDNDFRKCLVQGFVHDPAAAMMGGVSGNAGLFSNAYDLAVIMQMLLNHGAYGGKNYLNPNTIKTFTSQQFLQNHNRRGLLFDKPETNTSKPSPCSKSTPAGTFGHQGFTGTCVWADPEHDLIYVFLSNRVYPDAENNKIVKMNIRTDIQEAIYRAMRGESGARQIKN